MITWNITFLNGNIWYVKDFKWMFFFFIKWEKKNVLYLYVCENVSQTRCLLRPTSSRIWRVHRSLLWWQSLSCEIKFYLWHLWTDRSVHKLFRERQHPQPAEIRKYKHWLSVAILNGDPLHGTLHHATKLQAIMWFPHISKHESHESPSLRPGPNLSWKIWKFCVMPKIGRAWPF